MGTAQRPLQVVRVTLASDGPDAAPDTAVTVHVDGPGVRNPGPFRISDLSPGEEKTCEVPVEIAVPYQPGSTRRVTVTAETAAGRVTADADISVAEPGWTMLMVSHFHYDPVWWNTQGGYTSMWTEDPPGKARQTNGFELVHAHLEMARREPE